MKTNNKITGVIDSSEQRAVKVAGFMFLFSLIVPLLNWTFVLFKYIVADNVIETAKNIMANEVPFRFGITIELIMSIGLIILAVTLYTILKRVDKNLALLALLLKLVEAALMAVTVLIPFIALQMLNGEAHQTGLTPELIKFPIGIIFNSHTAITSIPMVFLGIDMTIFSYLFYKSKYIPRILGGFGILSFALIFIHALMFIIAPEYAVIPINQIIFWVPSGIFEIIIGTWLLLKGIKIEHNDTQSAKTLKRI